MKQFITSDAKRVANLKIVYISSMSPRLVVYGGGGDRKIVPLVGLSRAEIRSTIATNLKLPLVWD